MTWQEIVWRQFGAAIQTLENAIKACPETLWFDQSKYHQFWYVTSHTLFWLDYYLSDSVEAFQPPAPFGLEELDPAGVIPARPYTKQELLTYLEHGRAKCRARVLAMSDEQAGQPCGLERMNLSAGELLLYNLRHVQHHAAQMNLILRLEANIGSRWVFRGDD